MASVNAWQSPGSGRRPVIVLEPDLAIQRLLEAVLLHDGLNPLVAEDGAEAVRLSRTVRPAAYIVDVSRRSSSLEQGARRGLGFLHYLQRTRPSVLRRVIVMSALALRDLPRDLPSVHCLLRKPFNLDDLREAVWECVDDGAPDAS